MGGVLQIPYSSRAKTLTKYWTAFYKRRNPMTCMFESFFSAFFNASCSRQVNKSKKKQEEVNYLEILQEFLPKTLR